MKNENHIQNLKIQNFKSIKEMDLDCGRVNLFVGKPNVGKSNILEAMSLLGGFYSTNKQKFLSEFIRYETLKNLFNDYGQPIQIKSENVGVELGFLDSELDSEKLSQIVSEESNNYFKATKVSSISTSLNGEGKRIFPDASSNNGKLTFTTHYFSNPTTQVHPYIFNSSFYENLIEYSGKSFLLPPYGLNILEILNEYKDFADEIAGLFEPYGYELLLDLEENKLALQRRVGRVVQKIPFSLIADTLQRMIFYLAAVESNKDSVILFEEPEVHAYPLYVRMLAHRIVDSESNQFFITTHSPYLFNTIIESTEVGEVKVFLVDFEDYQTTIQVIPDEDLFEIRNNGMDIFFNFSYFKDGARV